MLTLFTKPDCPACVKLKTWLEGRGVRHREVNVEGNAEAAQFLRYTNPKNPGKTTVPALALGGRVLFGFTGGERERKWLEGLATLQSQDIRKDGS